MVENFESLCKAFPHAQVQAQLSKFRKKHDTFRVHMLDHAITEVPGFVKNTRVRQFVEERRCTCVKCGLMGNVIMAHRQMGEPSHVRHTDVFAVTEYMFAMMTLDHILPKSLGGANAHGNYQVMCNRCNTAKGNHLNSADVRSILHRIDDHLGVTPDHGTKFLNYLLENHPQHYNRFVSELTACAAGMNVRPAVVNVMDRFPVVPDMLDPYGDHYASH